MILAFKILIIVISYCLVGFVLYTLGNNVYIKTSLKRDKEYQLLKNDSLVNENKSLKYEKEKIEIDYQAVNAKYETLTQKYNDSLDEIQRLKQYKDYLDKELTKSRKTIENLEGKSKKSIKNKKVLNKENI